MYVYVYIYILRYIHMHQQPLNFVVYWTCPEFQMKICARKAVPAVAFEWQTILVHAEARESETSAMVHSLGGRLQTQCSHNGKVFGKEQ